MNFKCAGKQSVKILQKNKKINSDEIQSDTDAVWLIVYTKWS